MNDYNSYSGLGRDPNSVIRDAQPYRGLGKNPDTNIHTVEGNRNFFDRRRLGEVEVFGGGANELPNLPNRFVRIIDEKPVRGGGAVLKGAFLSIIEDGGNTLLQGGTVTGGSGNITIDNIKLIDAVTGIEGLKDDHLYLEVTGNGYEADGVLLPGFNVTAAITGIAATVPNNTLPESGSVVGKKVFVSLGIFTNTGFLSAKVGNVQISFCPGSYNVIRS